MVLCSIRRCTIYSDADVTTDGKERGTAEKVEDKIPRVQVLLCRRQRGVTSDLQATYVKVEGLEAMTNPLK